MFDELSRSSQRYLVGFCAFLLVVSIVFFSLSPRSRDTFSQYTRTLYYSGLVLGIIGLMLSVETALLQETSNTIQLYNREKEAALTMVNEKFLQYFPDSERLYFEMNASDPAVATVEPKSKSDSVSSRQVMVENVLANFVFRRIEEIVFTNSTLQDFASVQNTLHEDTETQQDVFLTASVLRTWKSWFESPLLRTLWVQNKMKYSRQTREFVDTTLLGGE